MILKLMLTIADLSAAALASAARVVVAGVSALHINYVAFIVIIVIYLLVCYLRTTRILHQQVILISFRAVLREFASRTHRLIFTLHRLVMLWHVNVTVRQAAFQDHGAALSVVVRRLVHVHLLV